MLRCRWRCCYRCRGYCCFGIVVSVGVGNVGDGNGVAITGVVVVVGAGVIIADVNDVFVASDVIGILVDVVVIVIGVGVGCRVSIIGVV